MASFRVANNAPQIIPIATPQQVINNGNIDIPGYYKVNGVPINNDFYPALSIPTTEKAIFTCISGNNSTGSSWNSIAWSPTLNTVAMVRQGGGLINRIVTSSDGGINWTDRKSSTKNYQGVVWCSDLSGVGMFVASAANNPTGQEMTISIDGITWTDVSTPVGFFAYGALAYSPTLRRVVATSYSNGYIYSNDGYNWVGVTPSRPINNFYNITWSSELGLFVTISAGVSNPINVSPDGINWRYYSPINNPSFTGFSGGNGGAAWSPELGMFCAAGDGVVLTSSDGVTWTYYTSAITPFRNLSWSPQLRIFFAGSSSNLVYSFNGVNWFSRNIAGNGLKASTWIPELGYLLTAGDTFNAIRSSPIPTATSIFDNSFNNINELGMWTFQTFGRYTPVSKSTSFTVVPGENYIICTAALTVTLPDATQWAGREITIRNVSANQVLSATSNIIQGDNTTTNNIILTGIAKEWCTLVSNGTAWYKLQGNNL